MAHEHIITLLEVQKRNKERVNVYLNDEYAFSLSLIEAAHLRKGQALGETEIEALKAKDAVDKAVDRAARFLAYRPRSTNEVSRHLAQKGIEPAVVEAALDRLNTMGYLDDQAFVRFWVDNRNMFKPMGAKALRYELRQKGVEAHIIDETLDTLLDEETAAYEAARGRLRNLRRKPRDQFKHRLATFLQRRGFHFGTARTVIERLITELEDEDPDFFPPDEAL